MPRYTLKGLLIAVTVLACGFGLVRSLLHVETAENVARVHWLPTSASNVSYYKSYSFTAYEFDIPERDFRAWSYWEVRPIGKPIEVARYNRMRPYLDFGLNSSASQQKSMEDDQSWTRAAK